MWLYSLFKAFFKAHECWRECWKLRAGFCMVRSCWRTVRAGPCCNQIQTPNASSTSYSVLPLLDTPSLSSVCAILRTGPYNCFSSQKFLLERLFLKESWWLMQSWSVFPAISSSPMTSPGCSAEGLCPPSAWHRHMAQLSAGVQLGGGCLEHEHWNQGKEQQWFERHFRRAQGSWRRCDSWDQASFGNGVNRSFRYTANTVLVCVLMMCYSACAAF